MPKVADPLAPVTFVNKIDVPTFMACQWTDEQTGGHCPDLAEHFTGTTHKWFTFTNGTHIDSLDPATFNRWYDFLELYVAEEAPILRSGACSTSAAPLIYQEAMGIPGVTLPPDPIQQQPTYEGALAAFEGAAAGPRPLRQRRRRLVAGPARTRASKQSFSEFPIPGTQARSWYLSAGRRARRPSRPPSAHADAFTWNADALPLTDFSGDTASGAGGLWTATPAYHWAQSPPGSAVSYLTAPLPRKHDRDRRRRGATLWVRSSTPNVDLQATISEVRPDGKETFVQNGWLRGNERKLDRGKSTPLEPVLSLREVRRLAAAARPLRQGDDPALLRGSRLPGRLADPGDDLRPQRHPADLGLRPRPAEGQRRRSRSPTRKKMPSHLLLPVVPGVSVPTALPPCPGLRGEPCRTYQPLANRAAKP